MWGPALVVGKYAGRTEGFALTGAAVHTTNHQGLGFGVKKFSLVWVFETPETLGAFVNSGWELDGQLN